MKLQKLAIIIAALVLLICSCQPKQSSKPNYEKITSSTLNDGSIETGTVPGNYIYQIAQFSSYSLLLKYHIPTGTASTVCQDPFCSHNNISCPFAISASGMASIGDVLYFSARINDQTHIRAYSGDSMKIEDIYISNGVLSRLFTYNYYLYFSEKLPASVPNEYKTTIYRLDTQSGYLETIDCGHESATIYEIKDGKIIWKNHNKYFSTDLDGDCEEVFDLANRQWGNYIYRSETNVDEPVTWFNFSMKLYRKDLVSKEETVVAEDIGPCYFYGDKIIYFKPVNNPEVFISMDGIDYYDYFGGNVYVMNLDGSDNRLLCHVDDCVISGLSGDRNNELVCGDWIGILTECLYDGPNGLELTGTDMLIVNVVTGEYKFIQYNPYE